MKRKQLLLLLALLMTAATGAWAQDAKHVITATYDEQTRLLEQPLPYETTIGVLYEAVTGEPFSDLLTTMTALEMPLKGITSYNTDVVSIGEFNDASTPVTVKADGKATVGLICGDFVRGIFVSVVPPLYVTMADGTKDAAKWTATVGTSTTANPLPVGGLSEKDAVTLTYGGRLKVKNVKATSAPSVPDGALSGVFSVSSTKKVNFSKGNLQAVCTSADNNPSSPETFTWQFAENQWDCVGNNAANYSIDGNGSVSAAGTVDLFGWSTAATTYGIHNSKTDGDYSGDFVDWGTAIGSGWRTLTHDEWNFLLQSRTTTSGLLFAKANLFGTVHGLILFPDNYTHPDGLAAITAPNDATGNAGWNGNQYTAEEWAKMEAAGAVFLPAAGCREGTTNYNFNVIGYYHTATPADANNSYDVAFHASVLEFDWNQPNHWAFSVRLVYEVATSDAPAATVVDLSTISGDTYTVTGDVILTGTPTVSPFDIKYGGDDYEVTLDNVNSAGSKQVSLVGNNHNMNIKLKGTSRLMEIFTNNGATSGKTATIGEAAAGGTLILIGSTDPIRAKSFTINGGTVKSQATTGENWAVYLNNSVGVLTINGGALYLAAGQDGTTAVKGSTVSGTGTLYGWDGSAWVTYTDERYATTDNTSGNPTGWTW